MNRRDILRSGLAGAAFWAAPSLAHTPYGQWVVYRQRHLLVGAHRGDLKTYEFAQSVVAGLRQELPEAEARVARGPRPQRIASLMGTGQMFLAVLSLDEAARMVHGAAPFEGYRPTPVHAMADLGETYLLFAAPDFPDRHARLVTQAIDHARLGVEPSTSAFPVHAGAVSYWDHS